MCWGNRDGEENIQDFNFKGELAAVETVEGPSRMDIVPFERLRLLPTKSNPIKQSDFKRTEIAVPEDLRDYFKRPGSFDDFVHTVKNVFVEYDEESGNLLISVGFSCDSSSMD